MKALVHGTRVCEVAADEFPVAHPLQWFDCDESVTPQHTFDGVRFVPPQPSAFHEWDGTSWVVPAANQTAAHNAGIDRQIVALEAAKPGYPRGVREFMLGVSQIIAQFPGAPDLSQTPGMQNVKALDEAIAVLRAQRRK